MELGLKQPDGDSRALLHRLSQLSEASLRINETLDDVRVERTGFEYSALVNQILARLWFRLKCLPREIYRERVAQPLSVALVSCMAVLSRRPRLRKRSVHRS